jgi:hypothetical protein
VAQLAKENSIMSNIYLPVDIQKTATVTEAADETIQLARLIGINVEFVINGVCLTATPIGHRELLIDYYESQLAIIASSAEKTIDQGDIKFAGELEEVDIDLTQARGIRNNNPLNIKWFPENDWDGQVGKDEDGFCIFSDPIFCYRAGSRILDAYRAAGRNTVKAIIEKWGALSKPEDLVAYVSFISRALLVSPTKEFKESMPEQLRVLLMRNMAIFECGAIYSKHPMLSPDMVRAGIHLDMPH